MSQEQAEAVTETIKEINLSHLATKQDLRELEYRLTLRLGAIMIGVVGFFEFMDNFF